MAGLFSSKPQPYALVGLLVPVLAIGGFMLGEQAGREWRTEHHPNAIRDRPPPPQFAHEAGRGARNSDSKWMGPAGLAVGAGVAVLICFLLLRDKLSGQSTPMPGERTSDRMSDDRLRRRLDAIEPLTVDSLPRMRPPAE